MSVDFAQDSGFFWLSNFKKFSHPWKTAGNIFGLGGGSGQFRYNISSLNTILFFNQQNGIYGQ